MALLHGDGFDTYGATAHLTGDRWHYSSTTTNWTFGTGRFDGQSLKNNSGAGNISLRYNINVDATTLILGAAVYFPALSEIAASSRARIIEFYDNGVVQGSVRIGSDGLAYYNGNSALIDGPHNAISTGAWYFFFFFFNFHATTGSVEFRVNQVSQGATTNVDTVNNSGGNFANGVALLGLYDSLDKNEFDDYYLCDDTGTKRNDFLGEIRIDTLASDGDNSVQYSRSAGANNYELVDDATYDDDTTYVYSSTATHKDLYDYAALPSGAGSTVHGVIVTARVRKENAGGRFIKLHTKEGANLQNSDNKGMSVDYTNQWEIFETYDGTNDWTVAKIDSAQFGHELV